MPKPSKAILVLACLFGIIAPLTLLPLSSLYAQWFASKSAKASSLHRLDPHKVVSDIPFESVRETVYVPYPPVPISPDLSDFVPPQGTIHPKLESVLSQVVQGHQLGQDTKTLARWKAIPFIHDRLQVII